MKRAVLVICDVEEAYARSFMEYLHTWKKQQLPFEIQAFTEREALLDYAREHSIEILLISERAVTEEVRALPVEKLVILSEGADPPELAAYPRVYKYQSSDQVVREVLDLYGAERLARFTPVRLRGRQRLIGVCSPSGYSQRVLFSLALGQILAQRQSVLFTGMDSYCALADMLGVSGCRTLSDLLYMYRRGRSLGMLQLDGVIMQIRGLDAILPAAAAGDLQEMGSAEWLCFLEDLVQAGNYDCAILDIGQEIREIPELLAGCDEIWLPARADVLSAAVLDRFESRLLEENPELALRVSRIYPPELQLSSADRRLLEGLCDGELGDFVRRAI